MMQNHVSLKINKAKHDLPCEYRNAGKRPYETEKTCKDKQTKSSTTGVLGFKVYFSKKPCENMIHHG